MVEEIIKNLILKCTNNNQILYYIKKDEQLLNYIKQKTNLTNDYRIIQIWYNYINKLSEIPKCSCGENLKFADKIFGYIKTCGNSECFNIIREKNKKETCLEIYGTEYSFQADSVKEKAKKTLMLLYGVDNSTKSKDIINKRKENNIKKWGVSETVKIFRKNKNYNTHIQKRLPIGYTLVKSLLNGYYIIQCEKGHEFTISKGLLSNRLLDDIEVCNICNEAIGSNKEQQMVDYIKSIYDGKMIRSDRTIAKPYEIDIVLPDLKYCFEFNGDYWHRAEKRDVYYHLNKLECCLKKGYKLFQIKEYDWNTNNEYVKNRIYNLINDIYDITDFNISDDIIILNKTWYDDRFILNEKCDIIGYIKPEIEKSGVEDVWNCGKEIYKIKKGD